MAKILVFNMLVTVSVHAIIKIYVIHVHIPNVSVSLCMHRAASISHEGIESTCMHLKPRELYHTLSMQRMSSAPDMSYDLHVVDLSSMHSLLTFSVLCHTNWHDLSLHCPGHK